MFSRRPSLLSVVVPAYDVAAYLPACLDSVLAQSETLGKTGLEVVVVDDGSPDDVGRDRGVVRRAATRGCAWCTPRTRGWGRRATRGSAT